MTVAVGPMSLEQPEPLDDLETYFTGTMPSGGYWTILSRLSSHDHSGGLLGGPVAVTIPDGSITAADLDPSVLAPYALTDGSKPFTGEVTMQADAVVRDALRFGEQGTALAPDATLSRVSAGALRVDNWLSVGGAAPAAAATERFLQVGAAAFLKGQTASFSAILANNSYWDGSALRAVGASGAASLTMDNGAVAVATAPSVAAGAAQTFTTRLALALTGTLTLTPDAGQAALAWSGGNGTLRTDGGGNPTINSGPMQIHVTPANYFGPSADNAYAVGWPTFRFTSVNATTGTIQTSQAQAKEAAVALDPVAAYQAAKDVRWYSFTYLPPTPPEAPTPLEDESPDDHQRRVDLQQAQYVKMLAETAPARNQRGFVFGGAEARDAAGEPLPPVPDLFGLSDRQSTTPQADVATLGCALQEVIRRLELLEAGSAA